MIPEICPEKPTEREKQFEWHMTAQAGADRLSGAYFGTERTEQEG